MFLQVISFELIAITLLYNGGCSDQWFSYLIAILFQTLAFVNYNYL